MKRPVGMLGMITTVLFYMSIPMFNILHLHIVTKHVHIAELHCIKSIKFNNVRKANES